ncbi:hypothetical protein JK200_11420 [Gluconobacter cerinus]|nr:hypothetical protein [Gluconobacter cerinus]MBS1044537.1 hypothetical protein [Gluconobacter cerinus]
MRGLLRGALGMNGFHHPIDGGDGRGSLPGLPSLERASRHAREGTHLSHGQPLVSGALLNLLGRR